MHTPKLNFLSTSRPFNLQNGFSEFNGFIKQQNEARPRFLSHEKIANRFCGATF